MSRFKAKNPVTQICVREKGKMQSVHRGSVKYFLDLIDFFDHRMIHLSCARFFPTSYRLAALLLISCCPQQKNSKPTATWREGSKNSCLKSGVTAHFCFVNRIAGTGRS